MTWIKNRIGSIGSGKLCTACVREKRKPPVAAHRMVGFCLACGWAIRIDGTLYTVDPEAAMCVATAQRAGDLDLISPGDNEYSKKRNRILDEVAKSAIDMVRRSDCSDWARQP